MSDNESCPYPFRAADRLDLDPEFVELRRRKSLLRVTMPFGGDGWLAIRHEDVKAILGDNRFSRAAVLDRDVARTQPIISRTRTILTMDGPEHTRLRRLAAQAFTGKRMDEFRPRVQAIVDELVDDLFATGQPADLIDGLALSLPNAVICALFGVPTADGDRFRAWTARVASITAFPPSEIQAANDELRTYLAELVHERRVEPSDDLLGALVLACDEHNQLSEDELVGFGVILLIAGYETTANLIGNFIYTLLTHPDQLENLKANPDMLESAVEELLRFVPAQASAGGPRVATQDVQVGDVLVRAGETVLPQLAAANRDEAVFEDPERLDLAREFNPQLTFGYGAHFCLAAQLGRMELQVAIGTLLRRMPNMQLAVPAHELPWKTGMMLRGLGQLPVTW
jgi:cytochrome P450 RapN